MLTVKQVAERLQVKERTIYDRAARGVIPHVRVGDTLRFHASTLRKRWYYVCKIRGRRHRGAIPEARTQEEAEKAETLIRLSVHKGTYGKSTGTEFLSKVVKEVFLPYPRLNNRSPKHD